MEAAAAAWVASADAVHLSGEGKKIWSNFSCEFMHGDQASKQATAKLAKVGSHTMNLGRYRDRKSVV